MATNSVTRNWTPKLQRRRCQCPRQCASRRVGERYPLDRKGMGRNPLHLSVKAQLERADRCIAGASSLARLMHRLSIGAADVQNTPPEDGVLVVYPDVGANETDRLWLALNELIDYAELSIERSVGTRVRRV
ncbi:hypothetical protein SNK04_014132 [Fusarium graminearum]